MNYILFILLSLSVFAKEDEAAKLVGISKQRRETWKTFRQKVSEGNLCEPRDYKCLHEKINKVPGIHPEDLISLRSILEPFYLRSIKDDPIPCGDACQHTMRASNLDVFLQMLMSYNTAQEKVYNFKDSTTVNATRIRAYMDLSAFGNMRKHLEYLQSEYAKLDLAKVTNKNLQDKKMFDYFLFVVQSGQLFSHSVLCHLHPGRLVYDEIAAAKTKVEEKYRGWLKDFDEHGRKACVDQAPIEFRGMDQSTREYYDKQTEAMINAMDCKPGEFGCIRKHLRKIPIHYAKDVQRVAEYLGSHFQKLAGVPGCDQTCRGENVLRTAQTFITYLSQYDRQKLASTMDWTKYPEERFRTITEDVSMYDIIEENLSDVLNELSTLDPAKVQDEGLRSELKSIGKDVSDYMSGKMFKDSVICTMEPWTAAYDRYMTPYKEPKQNKKFEQRFIHFKEKICK